MSKRHLLARAAAHIRKHPRLVEVLTKTAHAVSPETVALLNYPIHQRRRWDEDHPHPQLYDLLDRHRAAYRSLLQTFLPLSDHFARIPARTAPGCASPTPCWINGWMPALDGVALYGLIAAHQPRTYLEVGSGNSTKFARQAIADHRLDTRIVSIDPCPRADINSICDEVVRQPVEEVPLETFDRLEANDILYIDNSHRVFMNSDATMIFLDVLPRLKPGVLVEIHDVTLPYDYPHHWVDRYYSEQYLLAAYLLAKGDRFDIVLPNMFISHDAELKSIMAPLWAKEEMKGVQTHGCSFWLRVK
jgi:hypothetical protein